MRVFREWEGYVYKNNSKQIFTHLHHPDRLDSKERLRVCVHARACVWGWGCILSLEAANSNENSPPTGREIAHSFS